MLARAFGLRSVATMASAMGRQQLHMQTSRGLATRGLATRGLATRVPRSALRRQPLLPRTALALSIRSRRGYADFPGQKPPPEGSKNSNQPEYWTPAGTPAGKPSPSESDADPILPTDANTTPLSQMETGAARESIESSSSQTSSGGSVIPPPPPGGPDDPHSRILPGHGRGADGLPKSAYISSTDRKRERVASLGYTAFFLMLLGGAIYLGRDWDNEDDEKAHPDAPSGFSPGLFYKRIQARIRDILDYYNEPVFDKLLPDPIPDPDYQRPYTLVLGLEDLLVHTDWDREHGWRTAKRPGLDYFLGYLSMYYELVVFSDQPSYLANPILEKLNTYPGYISHGLAREATKYKGGKYIKDLSHLNRDLSKVILVDTKSEAAALQPNNAIIIPPWDGNPNDRELIPLLNVLEFIAAMGVPDVRPVITDFGDKHIPTEFALREAAARKKFNERIAAEKAQKKESVGTGLMSLLLGIKPSLERQKEQEKMLQDQIRERGQQNYKELIRMVMAQKDKVEEEEKQRLKEMNEAMKTSLSKILTEGLPRQPGT